MGEGFAWANCAASRLHRRVESQLRASVWKRVQAMRPWFVEYAVNQDLAFVVIRQFVLLPFFLADS
jgi:hypothetical protein